MGEAVAEEEGVVQATKSNRTCSSFPKGECGTLACLEIVQSGWGGEESAWKVGNWER